jgi:MFS transporter, NNP family, nitrate/nitrite transporter
MKTILREELALQRSDENRLSYTECGHPGRLPVGAILLFTLCFYVSTLTRAIFAPLLLSIEQSLNISHGAASSLFLFMSIGYAPVVFTSGFVAMRIKHRGTIVAGMAVLAFSLVFLSQSRSLAMVRVSTLMLGMASGFYTASGIASIIHITPTRHQGKAIALHELGPILSTVTAPLIVLTLLPLMPWRSMLLLLAAVAFAAAIAFWLFDSGSNFRGVPPNISALRIYLLNRDFWVITAFFALNACAAVGAYSILPTYLILEREMSSVMANSLVSLSRIGSVAIVFISGWLVDRFGSTKLIAGSMLLTAIATIVLGAGNGVILAGAVLIQPMIAVVFFTPAFSALSRIGPPESRNVAISLTSPIAFVVGGGVFPAFLGVLGESGRFYIGFIILGAIMVASLPALWILNLKKPRLHA